MYVVDFYCHALKLVIELDGGIHEVEDVKRNDEYREQHLNELKLRVLRFKNEDIFYRLDFVMETIGNKINEIQNPPLRDGGKEKLFVIKIGGNVIDDEANLSSFLRAFASVNERKILVHGGGKIATKIGDKLGIESKYVNGRRLTDDNIIDIVTMVYGGLVNKKIVARLQSLECNAIGLTGADGNLLPAKKRPMSEIDYGWVGDLDSKQLPVTGFRLFLENNFVPVFAPLTHDGDGHILNTNADTIASSIAVALSAIYDVRLIYCFEKKGVLENVEDESSVIHLLTKEKYQKLLSEQKLFAGILPKIDNAFSAIDAGVKEVLIGDAKDLVQNTTAATSGTLITQ